MIETLSKHSVLPSEYNSNSALHSIPTNSLKNSLRSNINTNSSGISNNLNLGTSMQQEDISQLRSFSPRQDSISIRTSSSSQTSSIGSILSSSPNSTYSFLAEQALFPSDNENESNNSELDTLLSQDLTMLKSEENFEQSSFTEFDTDSLKRLLRHYCLDNLCMTEENRHLKRDYTATKMNNEALKKLLAAKDNVLQKMELEKQQLNDRIKWLEVTLENSLSSKHLTAGSSSKSSSNPNLLLGDAVPRTSSDSNGKPSIENNIVKNIWFKFKKPHEGKHLESEDIDSNVLDMMDSSISSYPTDAPLSPSSLISPKSKSKSKIFSSLSWSHSPPHSRKSLDLESAVNQGPNTMSRAEMRSMLFSKPEANTTHTNGTPPSLSPPASPATTVSSPMKHAANQISSSPEKSKSPLNQVLSSPEKAKSSPNLIAISSLEKTKPSSNLASPSSPDSAKSAPSVTISTSTSSEKSKSSSPTKSNRISFYSRPKSRYSDFIKQQEDLEVEDLDDSIDSINDQSETDTNTNTSKNKKEKRVSLIALIKSSNAKEVSQAPQIKESSPSPSPNSSPNSSKVKLVEEQLETKDKTEKSEKRASSTISHKSTKQRPDKPLPPIPHGFSIKKQQGMVVRRKSSRRRNIKPLPNAPNNSSFSESALDESINPDIAQLHIQTPSTTTNPSPSQSIETN